MMALVFAVMLVVAMSATAFAAEIDVTNVVDGEEYTAYKILNYSKGSGDAISYYLTADEYNSIGSALEDAGFEFDASSDGTRYTVKNAETIDIAAAAEALADADLGDALGKFTATGADGEANFTGLTAGYYFVTTTTGSLCALHGDADIATAVEKNTVPTVDKKESASEGSYTDGPIDVNIGDTVYYQIEVTDGVGTDADITLTDTMSTGLTYKAGSIKINGSAVTDTANTDNWQVTVSGQTITIKLKAAYVESVGTGEKVTITYQATLNENAVVDDDDANENEVTMTYSHQTSQDQVYVQTYDFLVKKTDGTNFLDGAEFKLYDAATGGNQILLSSDSKGLYKDASGSADTTIDIDSANGVNVRGLAPGTYYLEEVVTPAGYNQLTERKPVTVVTGGTAPVEITVVNNAGTELPSTGGIGTTLFYIVGAILVVGSSIMLVSRKRMQK